MAGFVLLLHVVGWGVLVFAVAPHDYQLGSTGVLGVGVGLTAYMLGVRHAFDADHIASIDNTTRKLVGEGRPSVSAGFWFSLGHSSVVFVASLLLVAGRALGRRRRPERGLRRSAPTLGLVGTIVAGAFLLLIGLMNLVAAVGIARVFRRMRTGEFDEAELERAPAQPRLPRPAARPGDPAGQQAVAPLPGRPAHGPGLRHRHRRSPCSCWPPARPRSCCPGTRSWCCRCSSPPA